VTQDDFSPAHTKVTSADPRRVANLWLRPGDLLIERSNTAELVGTAAQYRGPEDFAIYPDLIIRARVSDAVTPDYAEIVLKSPRARRFFQARAVGIAGNMPKIDQAAIEALPFPLPPPDDQVRIAEHVASLLTIADHSSATVDSSRRRSATLRTALYRAAFAGRLPLPALTD
jgi:type I restriction enzyme S subunit